MGWLRISRTLLRDWEPRFDLLGSGPDDLHFVVEMDNEDRAHCASATASWVNNRPLAPPSTPIIALGAGRAATWEAKRSHMSS